MIAAHELCGLYAIIPTPAQPDADRWDEEETVDAVETARIAEALISDGASRIVALGATGECPTLDERDHDVIVDTVVEAVAGRMPIFIGATGVGGGHSDPVEAHQGFAKAPAPTFATPPEPLVFKTGVQSACLPSRRAHELARWLSSSDEYCVDADQHGF